MLQHQKLQYNISAGLVILKPNLYCCQDEKSYNEFHLDDMKLQGYNSINYHERMQRILLKGVVNSK